MVAKTATNFENPMSMFVAVPPIEHAPHDLKDHLKTILRPCYDTVTPSTLVVRSSLIWRKKNYFLSILARISVVGPYVNGVLEKEKCPYGGHFRFFF